MILLWRGGLDPVLEGRKGSLLIAGVAPVVPYTNSTSYAAKPQGAGIKVDLKLYDNVGHEIDPAFREQLVKESLDFADGVFAGK